MPTASEERHDIATEVALLRQQVTGMDASLVEHKAEQAKLILSVDSLNRTWNQATGALNFLKWLATAVTVVTGAIVALKTIFAHHVP